LALPPERELSQLAAPPKNQPLRIEDNPRSAGGQAVHHAWFHKGHLKKNFDFLM